MLTGFAKTKIKELAEMFTNMAPRETKKVIELQDGTQLCCFIDPDLEESTTHEALISVWAWVNFDGDEGDEQVEPDEVFMFSDVHLKDWWIYPHDVVLIANAIENSLLQEDALSYGDVHYRSYVRHLGLMDSVSAMISFPEPTNDQVWIEDFVSHNEEVLRDGEKYPEYQMDFVPNSG